MKRDDRKTLNSYLKSPKCWDVLWFYTIVKFKTLSFQKKQGETEKHILQCNAGVLPDAAYFLRRTPALKIGMPRAVCAPRLRVFRRDPTCHIPCQPRTSVSASADPPPFCQSSTSS